MRSSSGRSRIIQKSDDIVILAQGQVRRIMFFLLFVLLGTPMLVRIDPASDFSGPALLRTIAYSVVLLALLVLAGLSTTKRFDKNVGVIEKVTSVFRITVNRELLTPIDKIEAVVMQKAALFGNDSSQSMRSGVFGSLFEPESVLVRLFIETGEKRIRIDEGDDHIEETGIFFAEFLCVEFLKEEIGS